MLPRRALMNDKIVSAQGENLSLVNVKGSKLNALSVYGKSTQDGTPSPENPVPIVSAGSVMTTGAQLFDIQKATTRGGAYGLTISIDGENIKISGVASGIPGNNSVAFRILKYPENLYGNKFSMDIVDSTGAQGSYVYGSERENALAISFNTSLGAEVNLVFRLMVNSGSEALPWEPYTGRIPGVNPYAGEINVSVSDGGTQSQTFTLSTPGGLPGIPVTSGGNYTDESGQQWACDEIDLKRGKYVQRVGEVELSGTEYWTKLSAIDNGYQLDLSLNDLPTGVNGCGMCNYFTYSNSTSDNTFWVLSSGNLIRFYGEYGTLDEWKAFITQCQSDGIPLTVYYALATPIETDLPAEEIAAYKAMHTYTPNTSVGNDAEAGVKIGYREYRR